MSEVFISMILAGLSISFLHAILPNHWLPFVLAGRAQKWSFGKTMSIATLAGGGHILLTSFLGIVAVWIGVEISSKVESMSGSLSGSILILFGLVYVLLYFRNAWSRHGHPHNPSNHHHGKKDFSDTATVISLIALLTFSPCEGFLPVYLTAVPYGWGAFTILTLVLAIGTLSGMLIFTSLTLWGFQKFEFPFLEKYEGLILGSIISFLGIAVLIFR